MTIAINSLAAFMRFLALPGATVTVIRHDWLDNPPPKSWWAEPGARERITEPRTVGKLQKNGCKWHNGAWTHWDRGAACFRFDGTDTVTFDISKAHDFSQVCIYRLSIAEPGAQAA
jgi:hypothetical protein